MKQKLKFPYNAIEKCIQKYTNGNYRIMDDGEIAINSPFIHDTTFDCRVSIDKQCFHDFESGESGNIEELVSIMGNISVEEAQQELFKNSIGHKVEKRELSIKRIEDYKLSSLEEPAGWFGFSRDERRGSVANFSKARLMLKKKMVDHKLAIKYNLRWTEYCFIEKENGNKLSLNYSIIIPTYEEDNLVYYQARDYSESENAIRYKNPPKTVQQKGIVLPFYDLLERKDVLFISEGPWEAIQYSGTYMLGPVLSDVQVEKIKSIRPKSIYLIPDNDPTGRITLSKNVNAIRKQLDCPIYIVKWWNHREEFKDPIDAGLTIDDLIESEFIKATKHIELRMLSGDL